MGIYGAKWGLTDLYDDVENELEKLINSNAPFARQVIDSQKEIEGWTISSDGNEYSISVWAAMDDVPDIILDARRGEELTDGEIDTIADMLWQDVEFSTEEEMNFFLPIDSTLNDIYLEVNEAGDRLREILHDNFQTVEAMVIHILENRKDG